jgi:RNA polymerase sigma factor (sigma-70 family)
VTPEPLANPLDAGTVVRHFVKNPCHDSLGCRISIWMTAEDDSDESLTERLRSPDVKRFESAFRELYAAEKSLVYGLLLRLSGDAETAGDLFQNVWLKLARYRLRLREDTVLRAWLCAVARNEYLNYRRAQVLDLARLLTIGREPSLAGVEPDPRLVDVNAALQRLSDADREVLLLTSVDGLSPRQAAEAAGIREEALRQRLSRARRRLTVELEKESSWSRLRAWLPLVKRKSHEP